MSIILRRATNVVRRFFYNTSFVCGLIKKSDPKPVWVLFADEANVPILAADFPVLYKTTGAYSFVACVGDCVKKGGAHDHHLFSGY